MEWRLTNYVVGSMDIIGLYVEAKPSRVGQETCECVRDSEWELETDPQELGKLATLLFTRKELIDMKLGNCVPMARDPTNIPTLTSTEAQKTEVTMPSKSMLIPAKKPPNKAQIKELDRWHNIPTGPCKRSYWFECTTLWLQVLHVEVDAQIQKSLRTSHKHSC